MHVALFVKRSSASAHTANLHNSGTYVSMNGPAFSTRAESDMYRRLEFDIIGMTNAPEARLCREAEIAFASLSMVTDYDCWKTEEAAVDVSVVIANLHANSALAKSIIASIIPKIPADPNWQDHQSLAAAILTPKKLWPEKTCENLAPILAPYL
jgi:5'-methylthioadenosine phosphorylase